MPTYKVTIPYRDSKQRDKRFKVTYEIEAVDKRAALKKAKKQFNEFLSFHLASWIRTMFEDEVSVTKFEDGAAVAGELIDQLCRSLESDSADVKISALEKLADLEDERAVPSLLAVYRTSADAEKLPIIHTLQRCGDVRTSRSMIELFNEETSPRARASLVKAIGFLGNDKTVEFLEQALRDDDARVRANAIESLEEIGGEAVFELILGAVEDRDNRVKANAIRAIYRLKGLFLDEAFREMLHHRDPGMRISAAFAAGEMSVPEVIDDLSELLDDPERGVRSHALRALGKIRGLESLEMLLGALAGFHQAGDEAMVALAGETIIHHPAQDILPGMLLEALRSESGLPRECVDRVLLQYLAKEKQQGQSRLTVRIKRMFRKLAG